MELNKLVNRNFTAIITSIKGDGKLLKFHCVTDIEKSKKLEQFFREKCAQLELSSKFLGTYQLPQNFICCVKSNLKQQWCRGRIVACDANAQNALVYLIDYGNLEHVPILNLRQILAELHNFPPLAQECVLADVHPVNAFEWSHEVISFCEQSLLHKTVSCCVVSELINIYVVRLAMLGEMEPFVQRMINQNIASMVKNEDIGKEETGYGNRMFKSLTLEVHSKHGVSVCYAPSAQYFFIQLAASEVELKHIMVSIDRLAKEKALIPLSMHSVSIGLPCLVLHDQKYFRAVVKEIHQEFCNVLLVDYGNVLQKYVNELRQIPSDLLAQAEQALACTLFQAHEADQESFNLIVKSNKYMNCQIVGYTGEVHVVNLFVNNRNILALLKEKKQQQQQSPILYHVKPLEPGSVLEITTSYVFSPQEFYCQVNSDRDDLDSITHILQAASTFEAPKFSDIIPGLPVCAQFSEDGLWYRARVLNVTDVNNIKVCFVDFGNVDNLKLQSIRLIRTDLMKYAIHAYKFMLADVAQKISNPQALAQFETLALESEHLHAEIKSASQDNSYSVVLFQEYGGKTINKMIEEICQPQIKPSYPELSDTEILYVTNYDPPATFYGQMVKFDQNTLDALQAELNTFCNNSMFDNTDFEVGDIVLAKFSADGNFYRAVVEQKNPTMYNVFFSDYGNRCQVSKSDVRKIDSKFAVHPFFGIECVIDNFPLTADPNRVESLLLEKELDVRALKKIMPGKWNVALTENSACNIDILEYLKQLSVKASLAFARESTHSRFKSTESTNHQPSDETENVARSSSAKDQAKNTVPTNSVTNHHIDDYIELSEVSGALKEIFVSHVESPSEFYCQLISHSSELQHTMEKIGQKYNNLKINDMSLEKIKMGTPCCAIYEKDNLWYRGKVIQSTFNKVKILFVDFGNTEEIPTNKIKSLHQEFFDLPAQALKCSLFNTVPEGKGWSFEDKNAFKKMVLDKSFVAQFVKTESNGLHFVNLVDINKIQEGVLNKDFVQSGHGHLQDSNKLLVFNPLVASTGLTFIEPDVKLCSEEVIVTWVSSVLQFFCQLNSQFSAFKAMMVKIQNHYEQNLESDVVIDRPHSGMICVAKFSDDNAWYRAKILNVQPMSSRVYFVDYGNEATVKKNELKYIIQDFTMLPIQAIKCHIRGLLNPVKDMPKSSVSLFEGNTKCTFLSKQEDHYMVDLHRDGESVAQEIIEMKLAEPDSFLLEQIERIQPVHIPKIIHTLTKNQLVNVIVSYIDDLNKFWCQLEDNSADLDTLMDSLCNYCSNNVIPVFRKLELNASCLAKYSKDDSWYRAVVKKLCGSNQVEVLFVDYGNCEIVEKSEVRIIKAEFAELPAQAIECRFHGLPATWDPALVMKFQDHVDNAKELMAKVESINGDVLTITLLGQSENEEVSVQQLLFGDLADFADLQSSPMPEVPLGQCKCFVSVVKTPAEFFLQLESKQAALEDFAAKISEYCGSAEGNAGDLELETICGAYSSEHEDWFRAQVSSLDGDEINVFFVDYGNS